MAAVKVLKSGNRRRGPNRAGNDPSGCTRNNLRERFGHAVSGLADGNDCETGESGEVVWVCTSGETPVAITNAFRKSRGNATFPKSPVEDVAGPLAHHRDKRIFGRESSRRLGRHAAR